MKLTAIIFITIFLFVTGVSAQNKSEVLAGGDVELTRAMCERAADFFEWSLDIKLSAKERAAFQNEIVESWKKEDFREMTGVLFVLELSGELENWDEADRRAAQILIKDRFLKELERNDSNKINALLLTGYRAKHGTIDSSTIAIKQ